MKITSKLIVIVAIFAFVLPLASCGEDNCDDKMKEIKKDYGEPEEINSYDSDGYHNRDWWY